MSDLSDVLFAAPSAVTAGWSQLGRVLGSHNQVQQNAYARGVQQGASTADVMEQARRRRDMNVGFEQVTPEAVQAAMNGGSGSSALLSSLIHAGANTEQIAQAMGHLQNQGFSQQLWDRTQHGGTISDINPGLAIIGGKPVALTGVEGNTLIDKYALPNEQAAVGGNVPTAVGQSDISRALAEAGQANAGAARNMAEAERARAGIGADKAANYELATDSGTGQSVLVNKLTHQEVPITNAQGAPVTLGPKSGTGQMTDPKPEILEQAFGKPIQGSAKGNPEYMAYKQFQRDHAQIDPAYNNGDYALAQYMSAKGGTTMLGQAPMAGGMHVDDKTGQSDFTRALSASSQGQQSDGSSSGTATAGQVKVGQTATNPKTGERLMWNGSAWIPVNG